MNIAMYIIRMTKIQCISIYAQAQVKLSNSGGNQFYKPIWHIWPHIALWWTNHHFDALHEIVIILILRSDNSSSRLNSGHRDYTYIVLDIHNNLKLWSWPKHGSGWQVWPGLGQDIFIIIPYMAPSLSSPLVSETHGACVMVHTRDTALCTHQLVCAEHLDNTQ